MKEITRIHIAKTPYDIEVSAKKDFEAYLRKLELYADDQDWIDDIEIRITELLEERGVIANSVISKEDITALREQLGEPDDFIGDGDIAVGEEVIKAERRRLYRSEDDAVLGGVIGGIATYLGVSALWARIAFIILLFVSFGTVAAIYAILWLVIPVARTAAEKLQLAGKPVTLNSIKELRDQIGSGDAAAKVTPILQKAFFYGLGALSVMAATGALLFTIWAAIGILFGLTYVSPLGELFAFGWPAWLSYILFIASGLLLTALFSLLAVASFGRKVTKRIAKALIAITIGGIVTFSSGVGAIMFNVIAYEQQVEASRITKEIPLKGDFSNVANLVIDARLERKNSSEASDMFIEYVVTTGKPRIETISDMTSTSSTAKVTYSKDGRSATLTASNLVSERIFTYGQHPYVKVYGPALTNLSVKKGSVTYENKAKQQDIAFTTSDGNVEAKGEFINVSATAKQLSSIHLTGATVENLSATLGGGYVNAGVVRTLRITQPEVCPLHDIENRTTVRAVVSEEIEVNGKKQAAKSIMGHCGQVVIGDEEDYDEAIDDIHDNIDDQTSEIEPELR